MPKIDLRCGDALEVLRTLPSESVHCCVTSPPYWGLRDYGVAGQIGLESTPDEYVTRMVAVFREVRRVLRKDATCWVNLGDSYLAMRGKGFPGTGQVNLDVKNVLVKRPKSIKSKDLIGIPWRMAFALQADGWYLRQDIIWHKPSPMPESVTDRCTKAHEYIFLLAKSARYYYDAEAIREPGVCPEVTEEEYAVALEGTSESWYPRVNVGLRGNGRKSGNKFCKMCPPGGRNRRSVWTVATQPYKGAHFATFPPNLIRPMIQAGTSEYGCCPQCGAPWRRWIKKIRVLRQHPRRYTKRTGEPGTGKVAPNDVAGVRVETLGWSPACQCELDTAPCTVLDPFIGSGTTALVAAELGRNVIGIDINPEYIELARKRIPTTLWSTTQ